MVFEMVVGQVMDKQVDEEANKVANEVIKIQGRHGGRDWGVG